MLISRVSWLLLALASAAPLLAARLLRPSAEGVGTHKQLGLPACGFLDLFHLPCPACGLTTSFAHFAHGELWTAFVAHPLGPLFALLLALLVARACVGATRAEPLRTWLLAPARTRAALALTCLLGLVWLTRLTLHANAPNDF